MIFEDLNQHNYPTTESIDANLLVLYQRLKQVESSYIDFGEAPFTVNSGLRDQAQQQALIAAGKTSASKSKHLTGCAADIADPDGKLKAWLKDSNWVLIKAGLWCEAAESTPTWVHFQIVPPASGNRWFLP